MKRAWLSASLAALLPLWAGCSGKASDAPSATHAASPARLASEDSPVKIGDVVRAVQQHHGHVKLELDLAGSAISESELLAMPGLNTATALNLTGVPLTDAGLAELVQRMPELRRIDLSGTLVTDAGLKHLKRLPKLEQVDYHSGQISRQALLKLIRFLAQRSAASAGR